MYLFSDQGLTVPRLAHTSGTGRPRGGAGSGHGRRKGGRPSATRCEARAPTGRGASRCGGSGTGCCGANGPGPRAEALAAKGTVMPPCTVRQYLHRMGARYRRTQYTLQHWQDPARVAQARDGEVQLFCWMHDEKAADHAGRHHADPGDPRRADPQDPPPFLLPKCVPPACATMLSASNAARTFHNLNQRGMSSWHV